MGTVSGRVAAAAQEFAVVREFFERVAASGGADRPDICDFTFGNPHEMPLPGLVAALKTSAEPLREDWFAYKTSEPEPRAVIADALSRELGLAFEPEDVTLTRGAFGAIELAFSLVMDPGAEVDRAGARLVLLPADAARRRPRPGASVRARPRALRPRPRRHRGRDQAPDPHGRWSTRRTIRPAASTRARRSRRSPTCSKPPRDGSAPGSSSSPTSPTAASASTASASPARPRSTPGR